MKKISLQVLILLMLIVLFSCNHNRLKTNEKELAKEIITKEQEIDSVNKEDNYKRLADTLNRHSGGFRFKENRSVDPAHPPLIIDIAGSLNNVKEFKLSDVASQIRYVRMETATDSTFPRVMKFKYYIFLNNIIATNPGGILLYSKDGRFISTIVKNKTTGITVDSEWMRVMGVNTFIGGGTSVWTNGDSLYYVYRNSITGQEYLMKYDLSNVQIGSSKRYDPENPDQIIGQGEIILNMNPSKKKAVWKYKLSPELVSWGFPISYIYQSVGTFFLNKNIYAKELERSDEIAVINNYGDTLNKFTRFEDGTNLRFQNQEKQFLWNGRNDTIFQVKAANCLVPAYVFKLEQYKYFPKEGEMYPDFTGKIVPRGWAENTNFIFLTIDKDGFDSPNSRKSKKVKILHALFTKQNHQLYIIKGDPFDYSPEILENNLDGGIPVWPSSYMIGYNGEMLISLKGKELKDRVKSEQFKVSNAPEAKKRELEKLAQVVSDNEDILMIVK
jgi:hypothetical protein